jgi:proteasome lid subunit RPN8/RPN11
MFSHEVIVAAKLHAKKEYPKESCGLVVNNEYIPCKNVSKRPEDTFLIDPEQQVPIELKHKVQAVIHSHKMFKYNGIEVPCDWPSKRDMERQVASGKPWGIVVVPNGIPIDIFFWGDQLPKQPLLKRKFKWGVSDCYTLSRDFYDLSLGIKLPEIPRQFGCFDNGEDLFGTLFENLGFVEIDYPSKIGDGITFKMGTPVPNHCGVMIDLEHMLHQPLGGVSRTVNFMSWNTRVCKFHKAYRHRSLI